MKTLLQLNTIFLSMVMEAIPFILVGVIISGFIQAFLPQQWLSRMMPRNRVLSSLMGSGMGLMFPACECGIVPITKRLLMKGMPLSAGIAFMLTAPIINPIVLFSTYIAFGNDLRMTLIRAGMAVVVAFAVSIVISYLFPGLPFRREDADRAEVAAAAEMADSPIARATVRSRIADVLQHAVDEFFSVGKYLVLGAFVAASLQTFVPTSSLLELGGNPLTATLVMMGLAFVMSLCSEADAFIASSFRSTFSVGSLSAFLVFGPMIDIKNTLMLLGAFRGKFVITLIALVTICTAAASLIVGRLFG